MPYHRRSIISYHLEIKVRSLKMNQWAYLWRKDDWSWQLYGTSTARNKFPASQRQYFSDCVIDAAVTPQATQKDRKFFFQVHKSFFCRKWKFFFSRKTKRFEFFLDRSVSVRCPFNRKGRNILRPNFSEPEVEYGSWRFFQFLPLTKCSRLGMIIS